MRETNLFSEVEQGELKEALQKACKILVPEEDSRLGRLTFHLYEYENSKQYLFQIRWGMHKIFRTKIPMKPSPRLSLTTFEKLMKKYCRDIKTALHDYCLEQLDLAVNLELEPILSDKGVLFDGFRLKVCKTRTVSNQDEMYGWPNYCIAFSWNDEWGEYQEFYYPLRLDAEQLRFRIPAEEIVQKFLIYRETID